jgi:hypothetical protein
VRRDRLLIAVVVGVVALICSGSACSSSDGSGGGVDPNADSGSTAANCGRNSDPCAPGGKCAGPPDCASEICRDGTCNAPDPGATDTTDVGCGGPHAPACADGKKCLVGEDCLSTICTGGICQSPSCTDNLVNGDESDTDCGGSCPNKCDDGKKCKSGADCKDAACDPVNKVCTAPTCTDGAKNGDEIDVDCGGSCPSKCGDGKNCNVGTDCTSGICKDVGMGLKCQPPSCTDGIKNQDESDIDCGGAKCPGCAAGKSCNADTDCLGKGCNYAKKCVNGPSCKPQHGGDTCGTGEFSDAGKKHEDCCTSLPVTGYADANQPGKTVYLDKYEITAGRMREFLTEVAAANGGVPNVKAWMAAHRPATKWNTGWENILPSQQLPGVLGAYTISNPTPAANLLYPGNDIFIANPHCGSLICNPTWSVNAGNFSVDTAVVYTFQQYNGFPEYNSTIDGPEYAATHAMDCYHGAPGGANYGYPTYWFDDATVTQYTASPGGFFYTQAVMDEKALNCTPFGVYAAFCVWDGGQLATAEVSDFITGNTVSPVYVGSCERGGTCMNGKLAIGQSACNGAANNIITYADGGSPCYAYYYPQDNGKCVTQCDYDASQRVAPPGRMPADVIKLNAADPDGWHDMIGNLHEAVFKAGEAQRFDYRGYGNSYTSIDYHTTQETTARMKGAPFGARCMRFK